MADAATPIRPLDAPYPANIQRQDYARDVWVLTAANIIRPADLENKEFWINLVDLKTGDRIEVMPEDGSWFSEVMVRRVVGREIKIGVINHVKFDDAVVPSESVGEYEIKWLGKVKRFGIMNPDNTVFRDGFQTRSDAREFLSEHVALAA
jgi:hypothetical protein